MVFDSCLFYFYLTQHHNPHKCCSFYPSNSAFPFSHSLQSAKHQSPIYLWVSGLAVVSVLNVLHQKSPWPTLLANQGLCQIIQLFFQWDYPLQPVFPLYNFYFSVLCSIYCFLRFFIFKCLFHYCLNFALYKLYKGRNFCYSLLYPNTRKAPVM